MEIVILLLLAMSSLCASDRECWCLNHHSGFAVDWNYMRRSDIRDLPLAKKSTTKTVLDTEDLVKNFKWESGLRGQIFYTRNECASLELLYHFFFPWEGKKTVTGNQSLFFPFKDLQTIDYENADRVETKYRSWLQNAELNYWGHLSPRLVNYFSVSWILGGRFFFLKENFDMAYTRLIETSDYKIETKNFLYGVQLGAIFEVNPTSRWTWSITAKGAGFLNDARQKTFVGDEGNEITLASYTKERWQGSWLLEGIGRISYRWGNCFHIFAGYQAFLLTGLALAPEQRDVELTTRRYLTVSGQIILDGFFAGMNFSY